MVQSREQRYLKQRVIVLFVLFASGFIGVLMRTAYLQTYQYRRLTQLHRDQYENTVKIPARRGNIYDRMGRPLALAADVPSVYANPNAVTDADAPSVAKQLSPLLKIESQTLLKKLTSEKYFVWLKRHVSESTAEQIKALNLEGIYLLKESKRFYPNIETAAQVVGFTGLDEQGLEGLEHLFDKDLSGEGQEVHAVRDARGHAVLEGELDPTNLARGADMQISLDLHIQHALQEALAHATEHTHASMSMGVVMDVESGDILAMAVDPTFDPNSTETTKPERRRNRTVTDLFEPGSTLKPLVVAAALDAGAVREQALFDCENGAWRIGSHIIRDTSKHNFLDVSQIVAKSSNIGAAKIGMLLGKERLEMALRHFGFGKPTGISFPGEVAGLLHDSKTWPQVTLATISFGHGVAVNALQLAAAYRAIAHQGEYIKPRLVHKLTYPDGHSVFPEAFHSEDLIQVIRPETAETVTRIMERVVSSEGTGIRARVPGYRVAGKTGTAQKIDPITGRYSNDTFMALFAGFLPAENPKVVIVVALDEPEGEHTGGLVAAPVFAEIAAASMRELNVMPTEPLLDTTLSSRVLQNKKYPREGVLEKEIIHENIPVLDAQVPGVGIVPLFVGMNARQALTRVVDAGLTVDVDLYGSGLVIRQEPASGTPSSQMHGLQLFLSIP